MREGMSCSILGVGVAFACAAEKASTVFAASDMESSMLPPRVRRRMSMATKLAIAAGERACSDAGIEADSLPCVFASVAGEIKVTDILCRAIAQQELPVSPTQFHNSVHNTAAGYWSMTTKNKHPMQAIGAGENTLFAALVESMMQLKSGAEKVLLVCYEETAPEPLMKSGQFSDCAVGFVLSKVSSGGVRVGFERGHAPDCPRYGWSAVYKAFALALRVKGEESGCVLVSDTSNSWVAEVL